MVLYIYPRAKCYSTLVGFSGAIILDLKSSDVVRSPKSNDLPVTRRSSLEQQ